MINVWVYLCNVYYYLIQTLLITGWSISIISSVTGEFTGSWGTDDETTGGIADSWGTNDEITGEIIGSWEIVDEVTVEINGSWGTDDEITGGSADSWVTNDEVTGEIIGSWEIDDEVTGEITGSWGTDDEALCLCRIITCPLLSSSSLSVRSYQNLILNYDWLKVQVQMHVYKKGLARAQW